MKPITPIAPGLNLPVTVYAANQPEYCRLPAYIDPKGSVLTRWQPSWRERWRILFGGSLWLTVLTFGRHLQPVRLGTECPITKEDQKRPEG